MQFTNVSILCLLSFNLLLAIIVKPNSGNNEEQLLSVENHADLTKNFDSEHSVRYIPQSPSSIYLSPTKHPQQQHERHHHLPLDNLNLVRYLQSLPNISRPQQQIPSIAFLYGGGNIKQSTTAGFLYKARNENNINSGSHNSKNKDSYPVSATMYPIYNNHHASVVSENKPKYHSQQVYPEKLQILTKIKQFTPFLKSNKIPGAWLPINYKNYYTKGKVIDEVQKEFVNTPNEYVSAPDEDFVPITNPYIKHKPSPAPPTPSPQILYKSKYKNIVFQSEKSIPIIKSSTQIKNEADIKPLVFTTTTSTERPILFNTEHSSPSHTSSTNRPDSSYEINEELIYKLNENISSKNENDEAPPFLPELPYGPIELYKPHQNFSQHDSDEFKYYKISPSIRNHHESFDKENYDSDYDDTDTVKDANGNSGRPGIDYPILHQIPKTSFSCKEQRYKGFFGDVETGCQVWHYCDLNGGQASFLCTNGTIFSQQTLTCEWWFKFNCSSSVQLYVLNERLYKFILPYIPKFPQDFQGPLVDKYLAIKFHEMEEKLKKEKEEEKVQQEVSKKSSKDKDDDDDDDDGATVEGKNETSREDERDNFSVTPTVESSAKDQLIESKTPIDDSHNDKQTIFHDENSSESLQSIEPQVEIKNIGATGHLIHTF